MTIRRSHQEPEFRRQHERERIICSGTIEVEGAPAILCMVRDLSEGGARLRIPLDVEVPASIVLHVPSLGWKRPARVAWDQRHSIGVAFEGPAIRLAA